MNLRFPRLYRKEASKPFPVWAPTLPMEIQCLILDLADNNLQLRNLCHVCRFWKKYAQKLIFREVWVTSKNVRSLLALLRTRRDLGRCVITLRVVECFQLEGISPASQPVLEQLLHLLPSLMPNIHTLDLLGRKFGPDLIRTQLTAHCACIADITHLRLRSGIFTSADHMLGFIALFPRLEELEILGRYTVIAAPACRVPPAPTYLKYLALGLTFCSGIVLAWLASSAVQVHELRVNGWSYRRDPFHSSVLKIGAGVTHLHLVEERQYWPSGMTTRTERSLPQCPALRSLVMQLRLSTVNPSAMRARLIPLLLHISSPHLTTIHFEVYVTVEYLKLPWDAVDAALDTFSVLHEVVFDLYGWFNYNGGKLPAQKTWATYEELCEGMKMQMTSSIARGILKFKCAGRSTFGQVHDS
ncbi:hypothetical protein C8R43DRAFT_942625 [Mycena crocata]|nr:hypothetical protein C8R43DRAFT_942625 [Mycena crocata]